MTNTAIHCLINRCPKPVRARGYCHSHYGVHYYNKVAKPYYKLWADIKQRCYNVNNPTYDRWGGRGITMYKDWINDYYLFELYITTILQKKPDPYYSLDRIDNDKGYEPGNLRWASSKEQSNNRRPKPSSFDGNYEHIMSQARKGIEWRPKIRKYVPRVYYKKKRHGLGYYDNFEEAVNARVKFMLDHFL